MIGTIDVEIQAHNPNMPLYPLRAFVNSPSSLRIRNVPKKIGSWQITKVYFLAKYPDGSIKSTDCVLVGGIWVGTIGGSSEAGYSENGYSIFADGIDENGNTVIDYCLGKGDIQILAADGQITPDDSGTRWFVTLLSGESSNPKDGQMFPENGQYFIWQDGEKHPLGTTLELDSTLTLSGFAADAKAVGDKINAVELSVSTLDEDYGYVKDVLLEAWPDNTGPDNKLVTEENVRDSLAAYATMSALTALSSSTSQQIEDVNLSVGSVNDEVSLLQTRVQSIGAAVPANADESNKMVTSADISGFTTSSDVTAIVTAAEAPTYKWDIVSEDEAGRNITIRVNYIDYEPYYTNFVTPLANGTEIGMYKDVKTIEVGTVLEWNPDIGEAPFYIKATCTEALAKNKLGLATYNQLSSSAAGLSAQFDAKLSTISKITDGENSLSADRTWSTTTYTYSYYAENYGLTLTAQNDTTFVGSDHDFEYTMTYADNRWTLTIKDSLDMETTDYCDGAADASTLYFGYVAYEFVRESTPHVSTDKVLVSSDVPFDPFAHGWKIELSGFSDNRLSAVFNGRLQGVNNAFNRLTFYGTVDGTDIPQLSDYSDGFYLYTCQIEMPLSDLVDGNRYDVSAGDVIGLYFSDAFGMSLTDQHPAQTDYNARYATFKSIKPADWK